MGGYKITGMGSPVNDTDAATKGYVDNALKNINVSGGDASDKVSKAGDIMAGQLDMNTNKIIGLGAPTDATDAANKAYVDNKVGSIDISQQLGTLSNQLKDDIDKKLEFVMIWENGSHSSSFEEDTINITGASEYPAIIVFTTDDSKIVKQYCCCQLFSCDRDRTYNEWWLRSRYVYFEGDDVEFGNSKTQGISNSGVSFEDDNTWNIPLYIYGIKGMEWG
jgi:hypothetical protein